MPKPLPIALAAGIAGALLFLAMIVLGPVVGLLPWFVSPVPLVAAGLLFGWRGGLVAAATAVVVVALASLNPAAVGIYLLADVLPALTILHLGLRPAPGLAKPDPARTEHWYPPGRLLAWLALLPVLGLAVVALMAGGSLAEPVRSMLADSWGEMTSLVFDPTLRQAMGEPETRAQVETLLVTVLPGATAASWLLRAIVGGVLGMALARRLGRTARPRPVYAALRLPGWYGVLFAVTLGLSLSGGALGLLAGSMAMVLCLPFVVLGFKLVHLVARRTPAPTLVLVVFYMVLFASAIGLLAMVFVGLVEYATDLRREAGGRSTEDE